VPWEPLPSGGISEPRQLGEGLDRVARSLGVPSASALNKIFSEWTHLVGDSVAANCRPVGLRDGRLTVSADDPAWSTQLRVLEPVLLGRLEELMGERSVTSIVVRIQPL
jgi:predicted nucleic acid-binding Zn ribbon protein